MIAVCHTVVPENKVHTDLPTDVAYQASSPGEHRRKKRDFFEWLILDEFALVTAMKQMGVVFYSRTPDTVTINFVNHRFPFHFSNNLDVF